MIMVVSVGVVIVCRTGPISPPIENSWELLSHSWSCMVVRTRLLRGNFHTIPQPTPHPYSYIMNHLQSALFHFLAFAFGVGVLLTTSTSIPWLEPTMHCWCLVSVLVTSTTSKMVSNADVYYQKPWTMQTSHCTLVVCLSSYPQWLVCQSLHTASPTEKFWAEGEGSSTEDRGATTWKNTSFAKCASNQPFCFCPIVHTHTTQQTTKEYGWWRRQRRNCYIFIPR